MGRSNWNFTTGLLVCPSFGPGMGTERPEAHQDHPRHDQLWKIEHIGVQGQRGPRDASPSGTPQRWATLAPRWAKPPGNGMRRRVPHGHQTRPNTKQSTVLIIIFSDRHSLGWARGGHKGGRAVGGPVQLRAKNRRGNGLTCKPPTPPWRSPTRADDLK